MFFAITAVVTVAVVWGAVAVFTGGETPTQGLGGNESGSKEAGTIYGFWEVVELNGEPPIRQPSVTFTLEPELPSGNSDRLRPGHLRFGGFDGCNGFGGAYVVTGDHLETPSFASTLIGCPREVNDQADRFQGALRGSEWSVTDGQLTLTGETGTVVVLREVETNGAVGVWRLTELDGQPIEANVSLTVWSADRFSGYAGCWIFGDYEMAGDRLMMSGATSVAAVTTTVPRPSLTVAPDDQESVPPLFGCETVSEPERQFLTLMGAGHGVIAGDELTITNEAGTTASFRRA